MRVILLKPVVIYPPTIDWHYLHQRPQQLFKALSRLGCICLFCNLNFFKNYPAGVTRLDDNLILANNIHLQAAVDWARANYPFSPVVIYYTYPPQVAIVRAAHPNLIIFDSVDAPCGEFASWQQGYQEALTSADIITATAKNLIDQANEVTAKEVQLLPNGCDYEHFAAAQTPIPISDPPFDQGKKIIGYIGAMAPWLDWQLINTMGRCLKEYNFVFIGPLLLQQGTAFTSNNMHYLGYRSYADLPSYLSNFSHCLIPFKITAMTKAVNPVKFWEYLASGLPILSTPLPEIPQDQVSVVTEDMFPGFIPPSESPGRNKRIELARNNAWTERAAVLMALINSKLAHG
jgi:glycosyltransferase involved in cell wall biosynthesis